MFSFLSLMSSLPIFVRMFYPIVEFHGLRYILSLSLVGLGALLYAARWPERHYPKKFDIVGSSHQLFHVLVVIGGLGMSWCGVSMYLANFDYECPVST